MRIHLLLAGSALLALQLFHPPLARAETYHTCAGFIDSLPATISTQGVWCLRHDLSTAITTGNAITIATNNVTIDCNDFKLGGLAAGGDTHANGIRADNRLNVTVRHCNVRGFGIGVSLYGVSGGGHRVKDNRFDGNIYYGMFVQGDGSAVLRNQVNDTGGFLTEDAYGIYTIGAVDILDNTVNGVRSEDPNQGNAIGIFTASNPSGSISGNRVRGLIPSGSNGAQRAFGIYNAGSDRISLRGNHVIGDGSSYGTGLFCRNSLGRAKDNIVNGFATGLSGCSNDGNVVAP